MKIGLYSITYLGLWYRDKALTLPELVQTAKRFGYDGVEIDGKRPHGNPLDWPSRRCQELRSLAAGEGIDIHAVTGSNHNIIILTKSGPPIDWIVVAPER